MTSLKVNLCAKNLDQEVKYNFNQINIQQGQSLISDLGFFVQNLEKEVTDKKQLKKIKKMFRLTFTTCVSFLSLATPAFAQESQSIIGITPDEIMKIFLEIEIIAVIIGVGLAKVFLILAGIYRMWIKKESVKESIEWSVSILKGYVQVLMTPMILTLIFMIIYWFFGDSPFFINPFSNQ
jgi:hypothetical protein